MAARHITLSAVPVNATFRRTSRPACRRSSSPASGRCPTSRPRTTGFGGTWPCTNGSPRASPAGACSTWPAARDTAQTCSRAGASSVVGVDANPEALRARAPALRAAESHVRAGAGRDVRRAGRVRRGRVPADDRARPGSRSPCSSTSARCCAPGGVAYVSTPEPADARAAGGGEVGQPVAPEGVPGGGVPRSCARSVFDRVELLGLFHARKLRVHELALRLGWDAVHPRCGSRSRSTTASRRRSRRATSRSRADRLDAALDFLAVCRS